MTALTDRPTPWLTSGPLATASGIVTAEEGFRWGLGQVSSWTDDDPVEIRIKTKQGDLLIKVEGVEPSWLRPVARRLARLLDLEPDWDSYGAGRIDPMAVVAALRLLDETMTEGVPPRSVVPTSKRGVQLEWHTRGIELEVDVTPDGKFSAYFEDLQSLAVREGDSDTALVAEGLKELALRAA